MPALIFLLNWFSIGTSFIVFFSVLHKYGSKYPTEFFLYFAVSNVGMILLLLLHSYGFSFGLNIYCKCCRTRPCLPLYINVQCHVVICPGKIAELHCLMDLYMVWICHNKQSSCFLLRFLYQSFVSCFAEMPDCTAFCHVRKNRSLVDCQFCNGEHPVARSG